MHSRTETERSIIILYAYTHFPSDEKKNPNFFYGPTQNDIKKVQWNEMQHLHVLPFYPEKVF